MDGRLCGWNPAWFWFQLPTSQFPRTCLTLCVRSDPNAPPLQIINVSSSAKKNREPIPTIEALYSPKFPLEVVRTFVMEALHEAVDVNQVHNRDPIGWSNENLFL